VLRVVVVRKSVGLVSVKSKIPSANGVNGANDAFGSRVVPAVGEGRVW
jgi:hypothetical protein